MINQTRLINFNMIHPVRTALANQRGYRVNQVNFNRQYPIEVDLVGNEAMAWGAIDAGRQLGLLYAGYPITPSSETMETTSRHIHNLKNGIFFQAEDEIASIAAILGAISVGRRALTATSGPGFSLMQENIGLAGLNGIPCVIANVQRGGPSTGAPTKGSQGDVQQSHNGSHGDYPIIVLAPSSPQECYDLAFDAFNIADEFLTPVIILSDGNVGQLKEKVELPSPDMLPFSNRVERKAKHYTGLYSDLDTGLPTTIPSKIKDQLDSIHERIETPQAKQRIIKTEMIYVDDPIDDPYGAVQGKAEVLVVAYGITARACHQAVLMARQNEGIRAGLFRPITLFPSDERSLYDTLSDGTVKKIIVAEQNRSGQYRQEIARMIGEMSSRLEQTPEISGLNIYDSTLITENNVLDATRKILKEMKK